MLILRCTREGEKSFLDKKDEAYIIGPKEENIPEGYTVYLCPEEQAEKFSSMPGVYPLPQGCVEGSFVEVLEDESRIRMSGCSDIPDRTIFMTALCNSNCIMCPYTENFRLNASLELVERLERQIALMDPYADYICITGGEPTLQKDNFLRILYLVKKRFEDIVVHILTNGRTFAYNDFVEDYKRVRPYKTILGIPLHASTAQLHDKISQTNGSFEQTMQGVNNLLRNNEFVELRIVTSKLNCKDLPALATLISDKLAKIHHVCFMGLEMMGNAFLNREEVWCDYSELWPYVKSAVDILVSHGIQVELYNYPLCHIESKYRPLYRKSITPSKVKYLDACDACKMKDECGGFFATTIHTPGITVKPF